jgi:hypothetical protein
MAEHHDQPTDGDPNFKRINRIVDPSPTPEQKVSFAELVWKLVEEEGFEAICAEFEARVNKTDLQTVLPGSLIANRYVRFRKRHERIKFTSGEAPVIVFKEMLNLKNVEIQKLLDYDHVAQTLYNIRQRDAMH